MQEQMEMSGGMGMGPADSAPAMEEMDHSGH
jgi:hypothetical protein